MILLGITKVDILALVSIYSSLLTAKVLRSYLIMRIIEAQDDINTSLLGVFMLEVAINIIDMYSRELSFKLGDNMSRALSQYYLDEFSRCRINVIERLYDEFTEKAPPAVQSYVSLTWIIPHVMTTIISSMSSIVYMLYTLGTVPMSMLIYMILVSMILTKYMKVEAVNIKDMYVSTAKITNMMREDRRFHISRTHYTILHNESTNIIANTNYLIDTAWTSAHMFFEKIITVMTILVSFITASAILATPNFNYIIYMAFSGIDACIISIANSYARYMQEHKHVDEFEELRAKYEISVRDKATQLLAAKIHIRTLSFARAQTFTLRAENISIQIVPSIWYLSGKNGAGKSTLLDIISGEIETAIVDMSINDEPAPYGWLHLMNNRVVMRQDEQIIVRRRSWREIICGQFAFDRAKFAQCVSAAMLSCIGPDNVLENVSGGERKRLLIAMNMYRVLMTNPAILILDEPDNHIDGDFSGIINNIRSIHRGPIFITLHNKIYAEQLMPFNLLHIDAGIVIQKI